MRLGMVSTAAGEPSVAVGREGDWVPLATVPVLGFFLEKPVQIVVGFLLFKVLGHEARRYRETAPDLPPSLRL